MSPNEVERIAVLEVQVKELSERFDKHASDTSKKLDDILALKNKGLGAFWFASALVGSGILTVILGVINWMKGA